MAFVKGDILFVQFTKSWGVDHKKKKKKWLRRGGYPITWKYLGKYDLFSDLRFCQHQGCSTIMDLRVVLPQNGESQLMYTSSLSQRWTFLLA